MRRRGLPVADAPQLRPAARRARLLRAGLTVTLAGLAGAAVVLAARGGSERAVAAAPHGQVTEIVLDVSGSVGDSFRVASEALERIGRGTGPVGLVLFSDTAQEALPPGSPPAELRPFARIFTPRGQPMALGYRPTNYESNPWYPSFSGGTRMSVGLSAGAAALQRDNVRGRILLITDLGDAPDDRPTLKRVLVSLAKAGIGLSVLTLPNALDEDRRWFARLEGPRTLLQTLPRLTAAKPTPPPSRSASFPVVLAGIAGLIALVLAVNELVTTSLRWREVR